MVYFPESVCTGVYGVRYSLFYYLLLHACTQVLIVPNGGEKEGFSTSLNVKENRGQHAVIVSMRVDN